MKSIRLIALTLVAALGCAAAPILTLNPSSGSIVGAPGGVTGWGFTLTSDPNDWITVAGSLLLFETNPGIGFYQDYIGVQGGPSGGVLEPGAADWVQGFDPLLGQGVGAYDISSFVPVGMSNEAQLFVFFHRFSASPLTCGDCYLGSGELIANVRITAGEISGPQPIPEPSTVSLFLLAGALGVIYTRGRRSRKLNRS